MEKPSSVSWVNSKIGKSPKQGDTKDAKNVVACQLKYNESEHLIGELSVRFYNCKTGTYTLDTMLEKINTFMGELAPEGTIIEDN